MASPPLQSRARVVTKSYRPMRGIEVVGPLARPEYESPSDIAAKARSAAAAYVDRHPEHRSKAMMAANIAGAVRGGYHMAKGLVDAAAFVQRAANPLPDVLLGRKTAGQQTIDLAGAIGDYVIEGRADPSRLGRDAKQAVANAKADLFPSATPVAANTADELARRFSIGMNQGELGANVASLAVGGPLAKAVGKAGEVMALQRFPAARYIAQGYSPEAAAYLAEPYSGMGSHWVPRRTKPPSWFVDSDYNVLKPRGITRGEMYELHARVDPKFSTARLPPRFADRSWRFEKSGLRRHGPLAQVWHGMPGATKAKGGGSLAAFGSGAHQLGEEGYQ